MAVVLRLSRAGTHKAPFLSRGGDSGPAQATGRPVSRGCRVLHPTQKPERIELKADRVEHWLKMGARPSQTVAKVLDRAKKKAQLPTEKKP